MKTYKIIFNPLGNTEAIKAGWSWPAFFFTFIWALVKRMWVLGIIIGVLMTGLFSIQSALNEGTVAGLKESMATSQQKAGTTSTATADKDDAAATVVVGGLIILVGNSLFMLVYLIISILFGAKGNKWREKKLLSHGAEFKGVIEASNPEAALAGWLKQSQPHGA